MTEDNDFKRASLQGRGWKIMRGHDDALDDFIDSDLPERKPPTVDANEIEELLNTGASLGTLPPLAPEPLLPTEDVDELLDSSVSVGTLPPLAAPPQPDTSRDTTDPEIETAVDEAPLDLDTYDFDLLPADDESVLDQDEVLEHASSLLPPPLPESGDDLDFDPKETIPLPDFGTDLVDLTADEMEPPPDSGDDLASDLQQPEMVVDGPAEPTPVLDEMDNQGDDLAPTPDALPTYQSEPAPSADDVRKAIAYTQEPAYPPELTLDEVMQLDVSDIDDSEWDFPSLEVEEVSRAQEMDFFDVQPTGDNYIDEVDQTASATDEVYQSTLAKPADTPSFQPEPSPDEAVPILESPDDALHPVSLRGQRRMIDAPVAELIPETPERHRQPDTPVAIVESSVSEGVGPLGHIKRSMEGIPLVEDIDRPQTRDLRHVPLSVGHMVESLIPPEPETQSITPQKTTPPVQQPPAPRPVVQKAVADERIDELWQMIDEVQAEINAHVEVNRDHGNQYQEELLLATDWLSDTPDNYDDVRSALNRIRGAIRHDRQIAEDIELFRPQVLLYITVWGIALVVLALLNGLMQDIAEAINAEFFAAGYLPAISGAFGGLVVAYITLHKHTVVLRDFDPIHMSWYMLSPLVGGVMGFLTFMIWMVAITTTVSPDLTEPDVLNNWPVILLLLAFYAGLQQNWIINRLRALRENIGGNTQGDRAS